MSWVRLGSIRGPQGPQGETPPLTDVFLSAHPVGSVYEEVSGQDPGEAYGGTWEEAPSLGAHKWIRRA